MDNTTSVGLRRLQQINIRESYYWCFVIFYAVAFLFCIFLCCFYSHLTDIPDETDEQNLVDLVKSITSNKRREYVTKALKTEKFDGALQTNASCLVITTLMRSDADFVEDEALHQNHCAICLEKFEDGDDISSSHDHNCKHIFHRNCVFEWLLKAQECPICRRQFLNFESAPDVEGGFPSITTSANSTSITAGPDDNP